MACPPARLFLAAALCMGVLATGGCSKESVPQAIKEVLARLLEKTMGKQPPSEAAHPEESFAAKTDAEEAAPPPSGTRGAPAEEPSYPETTVFRYTDDGGNLHFVTGLSHVPRRYRSGMSVIDGSRLSTYTPPTMAAAPRETQKESGTQGLKGKARGPWNEGQIEWVSYERRVTEARRLQKPICLVVYTQWCGACKAYKQVFSDPRVAAQAQNFVMAKVDADEVDEVSRLYAPDGNYFPRTLFLDSSGKVDRSLNSGSGRHEYFLGRDNPALLERLMKAALAKNG